MKPLNSDLLEVAQLRHQLTLLVVSCLKLLILHSKLLHLLKEDDLVRLVFLVDVVQVVQLLLEHQSEPYLVLDLLLHPL